MGEKKSAPVHQGEVLKREFLMPLRLSQHRLALDIGVDARRNNEIISGKRSVRPFYDAVNLRWALPFRPFNQLELSRRSQGSKRPVPA
jgi:addiction module HigA family antidote